MQLIFFIFIIIQYKDQKLQPGKFFSKRSPLISELFSDHVVSSFILRRNPNPNLRTKSHILFSSKLFHKKSFMIRACAYNQLVSIIDKLLLWWRRIISFTEYILFMRLLLVYFFFSFLYNFSFSRDVFSSFFSRKLLQQVFFYIYTYILFLFYSPTVQMALEIVADCERSNKNGNFMWGIKIKIFMVRSL